jgi:hypothetical protein
MKLLKKKKFKKMSTSFDSIFKKNVKLDPNLNQIFSKKIENLPIASPAVTIDNTIIEEAPVKKFKPTKKQKHDPECENRTIFVGNLKSDCKKEVFLL